MGVWDARLSTAKAKVVLGRCMGRAEMGCQGALRHSVDSRQNHSVGMTVFCLISTQSMEISSYMLHTQVT